MLSDAGWALVRLHFEPGLCEVKRAGHLLYANRLFDRTSQRLVGLAVT
jgi:hypothetical protein